MIHPVPGRTTTTGSRPFLDATSKDPVRNSTAAGGSSRGGLPADAGEPGMAAGAAGAAAAGANDPMR